MIEEVDTLKHLLFLALFTLIVGSLLGAVYFWYELKSISMVTPGMSTTTDYLLLQYKSQVNKDKAVVRSLTPAAPASSSSVTGAAVETAPAQKAPSSLTAPLHGTTQPSQPSAEEQAAINSLSAPH